MTIDTKGNAGRELFGPDLNFVTPLAEQLEALDIVKIAGDAEEYAVAWLLFSDENGGGASALWGNDDAPDAPSRIMIGVTCDDQEPERIKRRNALQAHEQDVPDFLKILERELVRRGRFVDNRRTSLKEIKAIVRAFLSTGGRLMLPPGDAASNGAPTNAEAQFETKRFLGLNGEWSHVDSVAAKAINRLLRRWRAAPAIDRIIRTLGTPLPNGWVVLGEIR